MLTSLVAVQPAQAGAGWGDTTNATPDPSVSATDFTGTLKVRTYYANSPQGPQVDVITGGVRDTGPAMRKFVDALPGLGAAAFSGAAGNLTDGTYIPVAVPDQATYPGSDYYEIAIVEYTQRMHSDLAKPTTLRGYVQIDPVATDIAAGITNLGAPPTGSKAIPLTQLDGSPVLIARPSTRPAAINGFELVQAYAVDKPAYLGPTIVALHGRPTRVKFYNGLPNGRGYTDGSGVFHRQGDLFIPTDHTLFGGGDGPAQLAQGKDLPCGDILTGPNNLPDPANSTCLGGPNADGTPDTPQGYVHVPAFAQYTENREELHLHGGDNPWISDGHPHQWIVPAADELGLPGPGGDVLDPSMRRGETAINVPDMPEPGPGAQTYYWPNGQSGRLMFYHDHATGLTRLNVYAGTAAGYLLADAQERALNAFAPGGEIPLVIQDKTFVPNDIAIQDAKWDTTHWGQPGDLWFPHVYETNQDPMSFDGTNPVGRWDGASFFWPVFPQNYMTPAGGYGEASTTPEAFMDTPIINGMAYPTMTVEPKTYRFRILSVPNDRMTNLSFFVADPTVVSASGIHNTEVKMVPFNSPNGATQVTYTCPDGVSAGQTVGTVNANGTITKAGYTESGPNNVGLTLYNVSFPCAAGLTDTGWGQADNRPGGVPDPATAGPDIVRIGNEGGLFQQAVVIPATPINYEYNKRSVTVLNVLERSLWLGPAERADILVDFSAYAGKTLILYNDSGAPVPAGDPRIDYYTGDGDQTGAGGAPDTAPGYGPNTRTIMQINVTNGTPDNALDLIALNTQLLAAYIGTQPLPVVPTPEYAPLLGSSATAPYEHIYTGAIYLNKYNPITFKAADTFNYTPAPTCNSTASCNTALATIRKTTFAAGVPVGMMQATPGQTVNAYVESKAIQELFEADYGRMNATLGVELPFTNVNIQTTIPLAYVDPATETIANGETQFWKITHNGVDSHPVHFHFINVQVINRVGWDGTIKPIPADEVGWKETVKMHPLEDIIVAVRAKSAPPTPFGMPHSFRRPAPNQLATDNHGITQIDPVTGNAPLTPYTNAPVDYGSEYVWHCHILGHEENDFMRPFIFKAKEVLAPSFTATAATPGPLGTTVTWVDPTPVPATLTSYDPISNPSGFLGNPNNEIGFRVERADIINGVKGPYVPLASGLHSANAITGAVNATANATAYVDTAPMNLALGIPTAPALVAESTSSVTLTLPALPTGATGFDVYRNGATTPIAVNQPPGTFVDTTALPGNTYTYTLASVVVASNPGMGYSYRVVAVTAAGETTSSNTADLIDTSVTVSALSPALTVVMPPAAPVGVTVTNPSVNSLTVNWPASPVAEAVSSYLVAMNGGPGIAATSPDVVSGLASNTSYSFTVTAINASGNGIPSAPASGLTLPDAPSALTAGTATATTIALSWTAPANATGLTYAVQGMPTGATATYSDTTAVVSGLTADTSYTFTVTSVNASGSSVASAPVTGSTLAGSPTALTVGTVTTTSVALSWTAPAITTGVSYVISGAPASATIAYSGTSAIVSGLAPNTSYAFTVAAVTSTGTGTPSAPATALTLPLPPTGVVSTAVTASSVSLAWVAPANAGGLTYVVQTAPAAGSVSYAGTTATVSGLASNTAYSFTVTAVNATGSSAASAPGSGLTLPAAPSALTVGTVTSNSIALSWTAPPGTGALTYAVVGLPAGASVSYAGTSAVVSGLNFYTSYTFSVAAINASGMGAPSAPATAQTLPVVPGVPTCCTASAPTSTSVVLNWVAPTAGPAMSYTVQRATNATFTRGLQTVLNVLGTNLSSTGLNTYTTYYFRVMAVNTVGSSTYSATFSFLPPAPPRAPAAPTAAASALSTSLPTISLTFVAPATGVTYTVYEQSRANTGVNWSAGSVVATGLTGTSWVSAPLAPDRQYRYYLVAVNAAGSSTNGATSNYVTPRELANAPTGVAATAVTTGITVGVGTRSVVLNWTLGATNGSTVTAVRMLRNGTGTQATPTTGQTNGVLTGGVSTTNLATTAVSATTTGLARNTTYYFQVQEATAGGNNQSVVVSVKTAP